MSIAIFLFIFSCLSSIYLIYKFEINIRDWQLKLAILFATLMNAFLAFNYPLFYIVSYALWIPLALFSLSYLSLFEGRSIK